MQRAAEWSECTGTYCARRNFGQNVRWRFQRGARSYGLLAQASRQPGGGHQKAAEAVESHVGDGLSAAGRRKQPDGANQQRCRAANPTSRVAGSILAIPMRRSKRGVSKIDSMHAVRRSLSLHMAREDVGKRAVASAIDLASLASLLVAIDGGAVRVPASGT